MRVVGQRGRFVGAYDEEEEDHRRGRSTRLPQWVPIAAVAAFVVVACVVTSVVTRVVVKRHEPAAADPSAPDPYAYLTLDEKDTAILADFRAWKGKYKKSYISVEAENARFKLYLDTLAIMQKHSSKRSSVAANHLADYTADELKSLKGNSPLNHTNSTRRSLLQASSYLPSCAYPFTACTQQKDWTLIEVGGASVVSPVKNQSQCGSCWAHATTAALESNIAIRYNQSVVSLSREALVACLNNKVQNGQQPWSGCNGGDIWWATEYTEQQIGGVVPDSRYPYGSGTDDGTAGLPGQSSPVALPCSASLGVVTAPPYPDDFARWSGATPYGLTGEDTLLYMLQSGPVAVSIDATSPSFQFYTGGVYDTPCAAGAPSQANNDHAVVVVGYGIDPVTGLKYWKIKNSWGTMWGESGYMRLQAFYYWPNSKAGLCGIGFTPVQPMFGSGVPPPHPPSPPPPPPSPSPPPAPVVEPCGSATVSVVALNSCSVAFEQQCGVFKKTNRTCFGVPVFALTPPPPPPNQFSVGLSLFVSAGLHGWNIATPNLECSGASYGMSMKVAGMTAATAMASLSSGQFPTGFIECVAA